MLFKTSLLSPTSGLLNYVLSPFGVQTDWLSEYPLASVMGELVWQWTPFMMLLILAGLQSMPKDISEAMLFLVSEEARYITGEAMHVSAGWNAANAA